MTKTACVVGHFGFGKELLNGQTIKTKIVTEELERQYGTDEIAKIDTHGGVKKLTVLPIKLFKALKICKNVLIFPAHKGVRIIAPLLVAENAFFKRKLHYVVIGGWISDLIQNKPILKCSLKHFDAIYVETTTLKRKMEMQGFENVVVMPNCKNLDIIDINTEVQHDKPYRVCTFSRVMKEKGIEDAVCAVKAINEKYGKTMFALDIYGQVDENQTEWFEKLRAEFPTYIRYAGVVPFDKSTEVLKNYYALLFPTYYDGEGFAGTLIDAMAAGVPIVASDWKYNSEIVNEKVGVLFATNNIDDLSDKIMSVGKCVFRENCLLEAKKYLPENAVSVLISRISD